MINTIPVITIDGPSGSGKGTIGQQLAHRLGWHFLDSGAIYRGLAWKVLHNDVSLNDEQGLALLAEHLNIEFVATATGNLHCIIEQVDVTEEIRSETCGTTASKIAAYPLVRAALLERQRQFRHAPGLVTDGRDMGSIVFPNAQVKFFLMASTEERAKRRYYQLKAKGINVSLEALCNELIERDRRDEQRVIAPLKPTSDALIIDTTNLSIEEVLEKVWNKVSSLLNLA